jgi:NADPH-dependent 2,4-dienoyl-CoA reductase/sulfur reductase-like enzyme
VLDTTDPTNRMSALRQLPRALRAPAYLAKGLKLVAQLARSGVPYHRNVTEVALLGTDGLRQVRWVDRAGEHTLDCNYAFVHQGVIPNVNTTWATSCAHEWDEAQLTWRPVLDPHGRSSHAWLYVAGDGGGISGARSAALSGEIAALAAAADLGRLAAPEHARRSGPLLIERRRDQAIRPFLERLYRPADALRIPSDDNVIICRCEEVSRGDVAAAVAEGCVGPNQLKSYTRAGMGPCQGRMCGHTVAESIAKLRGTTPAEVGYFRIRTPLKPVTVGEIAGLNQEELQPWES